MIQYSVQNARIGENILSVQIYFTVFSLLNYGMLCFSKPKLQKAGRETALLPKWILFV